MSYRILRTNKRERTITIRQQYKKTKGHIDYKSFPLSKEEFEYYAHYATEGDIRNFLRTENYYVLK